MIGLLAMVLCASAGPLARVEIVADDPGTFLIHELPMIGARPGATLLHGLAQVQPVWKAGPLTVGTSIAAITVQGELPLTTLADGELAGLAGIQTRLGLPVGTLLGLSWTRDALWLDLAASIRADASWARPEWSTWSALPTIGVGWVPGARKD